MKRVKTSQTYIYEPVVFDQIQINTQKLESGERVRVIQPTACPRNGTMGMCYVERAADKEFIGLVCLGSLHPDRSRRRRTRSRRPRQRPTREVAV